MAQLETAPTKLENGSFVFRTAPGWSVSLILKSTINARAVGLDLAIGTERSEKPVPYHFSNFTCG